MIVILYYMKDKKTAEMYSRGLKALLPKGFDWKDAGPSVSAKLLKYDQKYTCWWKT